MRTEYVLMNQTVPMLRFSCERNIFDEPEFTEIEWLTELRPIGYGNLGDFLARRQAPKHRKHIKELLERYGCDDLEGFLRVTHALSLKDTIWVKEAGSERADYQAVLREGTRASRGFGCLGADVGMCQSSFQPIEQQRIAGFKPDARHHSHQRQPWP